MGFPKFTHDPDAVLDYPMDWTDWLNEGDSLDTVTVTPNRDGVAVTEVVVEEPVPVTGAVVTPRVSSPGVAAGDLPVNLTYHVVTANGLEEDRSITLVFKER